jgi:hypothetical protein
VATKKVEAIGCEVASLGMNRFDVNDDDHRVFWRKRPAMILRETGCALPFRHASSSPGGDGPVTQTHGFADPIDDVAGSAVPARDVTQSGKEIKVKPLATATGIVTPATNSTRRGRESVV